MISYLYVSCFCISLLAADIKRLDKLPVQCFESHALCANGSIFFSSCRKRYGYFLYVNTPIQYTCSAIVMSLKIILDENCGIFLLFFLKHINLEFVIIAE